MKLGGGKYRAVAKANIISPEINHHFGGRYRSFGSRQNSHDRHKQGYESPTGSKMTARYYKELSMNSGEPVQSHSDCTIKPIDGKIAHNMYRQSDYPIVSGKPVKAGREKGIAANTWEARETSPGHRTGIKVRTKLASLTLRAKENPKARFSSLAHILDEDFLTGCFGELKRDKASGIDRVSVEQYGSNLEENIRDLVKRLKKRSYRPKPARRTYITKVSGSKRPLGIPTIEDKIVQMGLAKILGAIFEVDFLDVSFGFRPKRSCHDALNTLDKAVMTKPVNYIVDMDIEKFFETIDHKWLMKCLKQRIEDTAILAIISRMLKAGIVEEGKYIKQDRGTMQGAVLSPLLANIYLHFILDIWFEKVVAKRLKGFTFLIRYCDDYVAAFQSRSEAETFGSLLRDRLSKFGLKVNEEKSQTIAFGRYVWQKAQEGGTKPKVFDFLGFTHYCDRTRKGKFKLGRKTAKAKFIQKAKELNQWLKKVRNLVKLKQWWKVLGVKLLGHYRYYGISGNYRELKKYYKLAMKLALKWINRRSQKKSYNWAQYNRYLKYNPLPEPKIYHLTYALSS